MNNVSLNGLWGSEARRSCSQVRSPKGTAGSFKLRQALVREVFVKDGQHVGFNGPLGPMFVHSRVIPGRRNFCPGTEEPVVSVLDFCHPAWWEGGSSHTGFLLIHFPFLVLLAHIFLVHTPWVPVLAKRPWWSYSQKGDQWRAVPQVPQSKQWVHMSRRKMKCSVNSRGRNEFSHVSI